MSSATRIRKAGDSAADRELGLDRPITRRDFVNSVAVGTGAALLAQHAPLLAQTADSASPQFDAAAFDGFGGVGEYARSNGNTWQVLQDAHSLRDGRYKAPANVIDTDELYDVVVVGGGFAGMGAAHRVMQLGSGKLGCLVLDNHRVFGGEAKRNEFHVEGVRLLAPQGSNEMGVPSPGEGVVNECWDDLGLPREFVYSELPASRKPLQSSRSNYSFMLDGDNFESHGFYFPEQKRWVTNPWGHDLAGVPWPEAVKRDLMRWRYDSKRHYEGAPGPQMHRWLDTMTYEHYLTRVAGFRPEVARYADAYMAAAGGGLGSDAISAYLAYEFAMPGFQGLLDEHESQHNYALHVSNQTRHRFPGGNEAILRAFVKRLLPQSIAGGSEFADIHNGAVRFAALDRPGQATRIRLAATTVAVEHEGAREKAERVAVTYLHDGRLYRVRARGVVVASGTWSAKHTVRGLPEEYRQAMQRFHRSPMLVINVALTNWKALYKLGYTAASWRGGLGFGFNLAPPMQVGDYAPVFDPDHPAVLTYYVPFCKVGLPVEQQGQVARHELLAKSYREYERELRAQLSEMLGAQGFDARKDIAGIILNRWGHAYVNAYPGFFFGRDGKPAPSQVLRRAFGRIAFGNSELTGFQLWSGAVEEGRRAAEQVLSAAGLA